MTEGEVLDAFTAGLAAVDPAQLVKQAVRAGRLPKAGSVLALGKAAPQMVWGLVEAGVDVRGLGVAPHGYKVPRMEGFTWLPGGHPVPDEASFAAGREVLAWAGRQTGPVLVLLSGGASACVEAPAPGQEPDTIIALHKETLHAGLPIAEMNVRRGQVSALKRGGLARRLQENGAEVACWVLQDTPGPRMVGSGPCDLPEVEHHVLADNGTMVAAAGLRLATKGYQVYRHEGFLKDPVEEEVAAFLTALAGLEGDRVALVGGGEPTVRVPEGAPPGGRNQHAALTAAVRAAELGLDVTFAALASDGIDGTTPEAGAWVTAGDADPAALRRFDAYGHLDARGRTLRSGHTGTNVADLWIALKG